MEHEETLRKSYFRQSMRDDCIVKEWSVELRGFRSSPSPFQFPWFHSFSVYALLSHEVVRQVFQTTQWHSTLEFWYIFLETKKFAYDNLRNFLVLWSCLDVKTYNIEHWISSLSFKYIRSIQPSVPLLYLLCLSHCAMEVALSAKSANTYCIQL